jgi:hypothetical protein
MRGTNRVCVCVCVCDSLTRAAPTACAHISTTKCRASIASLGCPPLISLVMCFPSSIVRLCCGWACFSAPVYQLSQPFCACQSFSSSSSPRSASYISPHSSFTLQAPGKCRFSVEGCCVVPCGLHLLCRCHWAHASLCLWW